MIIGSLVLQIEAFTVRQYRTHIYMDEKMIQVKRGNPRTGPSRRRRFGGSSTNVTEQFELRKLSLGRSAEHQIIMSNIQPPSRLVP
jgi:hypothetical protein